MAFPRNIVASVESTVVSLLIDSFPRTFLSMDYFNFNQLPGLALLHHHWHDVCNVLFITADSLSLITESTLKDI